MRRSARATGQPGAPCNADARLRRPPATALRHPTRGAGSRWRRTTGIDGANLLRGAGAGAEAGPEPDPTWAPERARPRGRRTIRPSVRGQHDLRDAGE